MAVLLGTLAVAMLALAAFNLLRGEWQYNASNGLFFLVVAALFLVNRLGHVTLAGMLTVILTGAAAMFLLTEDSTLKTTFIAMTIPILISSFLIAPWSGPVIVVLLISGSLAYGVSSPDYPALLVLAVVALIAFMFSRSLNTAYSSSRHDALHDALTGLPNRVLFVDRLQQAVGRKSRDRSDSAVLFMDLDHFKVINDSLGHDVGDELLIGVARRLSRCLRPADTAARLGGDEFTVLLENIEDPGDAIRVAERIAEELRTPFRIGEHQLFVTTSIGIALFSSTDAQPNALLRDADMAMYEAKRGGKARYQVFNSDMYSRALHRLELENELRLAIEREELVVYYQPKVDLRTGNISGFEALVRWEHPERGLVEPDRFIPLAEETALIIPIGRLVLDAACRQAKEWQERYGRSRQLTMSVNLSVRQFRHPELIEELSRILEKTGLHPSSLQLEITESVVTDDVAYAVDLLWKLKALNVKLGIDDFGKGYSSLASLKQFPLDDLKIDRSFVSGLGRDKQDTAIVQLVVDLAHTVEMRAVGEGVETYEQLARLREMGCDAAQGYYFSKPLPGEEIEALLASDGDRLERPGAIEGERLPRIDDGGWPDAPNRPIAGHP